MPIPPYVANLRKHIGHDTLLLPAVGAIIRDELGRVLLIRRGDGRGWSLPGGIMEPGERLIDSLVREVWEETGLEVEPMRLIGIYSDPEFLHITYPNGDQAQFVSTTMECRIVGGQPRADGEESLEVGFFDPDALPSTVVCDHAIRIEDLLANGDEPVIR